MAAGVTGWVSSGAGAELLHSLDAGHRAVNPGRLCNPCLNLSHNHATLLKRCGHPLLTLDLPIAEDDGVRHAARQSARVRDGLK